jgi:hypothetical protein
LKLYFIQNKYNVKYFALINSLLYAFVALNPFINWLIPNEVIYIYFVVSTSVASLLIQYKYNLWREIIFITLLLFVAYITLPIFDHYILRVGHLLWFIPLLMIIFYDSYLLHNVFIRLKKIIVYISGVTIIVWLMLTVGLNIPHLEIYPDHRSNPDDTYRLYGIIVALYRDGVPIQTGIGGIERACGIFSEPGHYGIILGLLLLFSRVDLSKYENIVLFIAGVITFSPMFYFIIFLGVIYNIIETKQVNRSFIYMLTALAIMLLIVSTDTNFGNQIRYLAYERVFGSIDVNPIDDRISPQFMSYFNKFLLSGNILIGNGYESVYDIPSTQNYRAFIYRYGILGVILCLVLVITILSRAQPKLFIVILLAIIGVLAHRYWMLLLPTLYVIMILGINSMKLEEYYIKWNNNYNKK